MDENLSLPSEKVDYIFPIELFTAENMEELSLYLSTLQIDNSDFSKGYVGANGIVTPQNKNRLEDTISRIFRKSPYGKQWYLDFQSYDNYIFGKREWSITSSLGDNSYEMLMKSCLYGKLRKEFDLEIDPIEEVAFGIEELNLRHPNNYYALLDLCQNNTVAENLYGIELRKNGRVINR